MVMLFKFSHHDNKALMVNITNVLGFPKVSTLICTTICQLWLFFPLKEMLCVDQMHQTNKYSK